MFCTKCGAALATDAQFCTVCGKRVGEGTEAATERPAKRTGPVVYGIFGIIVFGFVWLVVAIARDPSQPPSTSSTTGSQVSAATTIPRTPTPVPTPKALGRTEVCLAAHEGVKNGLRAPSTAKFPDSFCQDLTMTSSTNADGFTVWVVSGPVDAQNGFGAMIRSDYVVEITDLGDANHYRSKVISLEAR